MDSKYSDLFFDIVMQNKARFLGAGPARLDKGLFCAPFLQTGEYEALLYFVSPYWICDRLKDPIDFLIGLKDIGKEWKIFESEDAIEKFIEKRLEFYAANVNNLKLPLIVYYWMFTNPLSLKPPKYESELEFAPMKSLIKIPPLSVLINEINTPHSQNDPEKERLRKEGLLNYVDCINETINKYLGGGVRLDPRNFNIITKDAERVEKEFGISMEDANIIAVVNFRQDIRMQAREIPHLEDTLNPKYFDETAVKLLAKMSIKAREIMEEYWAEKFNFVRPTNTKR